MPLLCKSNHCFARFSEQRQKVDREKCAVLFSYNNNNFKKNLWKFHCTPSVSASDAERLDKSSIVLKICHRIISAEVLPGTFITAAMTAGAPGKKLIFCAVSNHLEGTSLLIFFLCFFRSLFLSLFPFFTCFNAFQKQFSPLVFKRIWLCVSEGESAFLDVHDCGVQQQAPVPGNIRRYYMMVDEYLWDYAPTGMDMYSGTPLISEDRWDISARWPFCLLLNLFSILSHN